MSEPVRNAEGQQARRRGFVAGLIALPLRLVGILCVSLMLSIVIEWVGMHVFWPEEGWRHAQAMLDYELEHVSHQFTRSALVQEPGNTAHWLVDGAFDWVFVKTGLVDGMTDAAARASAPSRGTDRDFRYYISVTYVWAENYLIAAAYVTLIFIVRLLVLTLTLPLFVTAAFVGFVDGLVRRDIRKFGAGRESGFVYHRAKAALVPIAVFPWIVYLTFPVSVHPLLILLPSAALLGLATNIAANTFKKYL